MNIENKSKLLARWPHHRPSAVGLPLPDEKGQVK
jgi:hypothetical protein